MFPSWISLLFCTCLWHCLKGVSEAHRSRKLTVKDKKTTAVQVYEYTHSCTILSYWSSASFFGVPTINSKSKKIAQTGHYLQSMAFNPEYSLFRRNMKKELNQYNPQYKTTIIITIIKRRWRRKFRDGWLNLPVTGLATTIWSVAPSNICIIAIISMISDGLSHAALLCLEAGE